MREALLFSARLRLPASVSDSEAADYADTVLDLVELTPQRNALVGVGAGGGADAGLSLEQVRRGDGRPLRGCMQGRRRTPQAAGAVFTPNKPPPSRTRPARSASACLCLLSWWPTPPSSSWTSPPLGWTGTRRRW